MSELGQKLRSARIEKGYSIDDLQRITKIQKRYLTAIEEGQFDKLPGDFYVRAFVKQYADSVGLNSDEILKQYSDEIPSVKIETDNIEQDEHPQDKQQKGPVPLKKSVKRYLPQIVILAIVLVITVIVIVVVAQTHDQNTQQIPKTTEQTTTKKTTKKKQAKKKAAKKKAAKKAKKAETTDLKLSADKAGNDTFDVNNWSKADKHSINLSSTSASAWITIKTNNGQNSLFQGAVKSGEDKNVDVPADVKQISIQTGNAPVTKVKVNDQDLPVAQNESGTVKTYTLNVKD